MQTRRTYAQLAPSLIALAVAGLAGCSIAQNPSNGSNQTSVNTTGTPSNPNSVPTVSAPQPRTGQLVDQLNTYRAQMFGFPVPVQASDVLYTSALRHVMYENSINSAGYSQNSNPITTTTTTGTATGTATGSSTAVGTPSGTGTATTTAGTVVGTATGNVNGGNASEGTTITPFNHLIDLNAESVVPAAGQPFPALYTDTNLFNRVLFVEGSLNLVQGNGASGAEAFENFIFNGNVWRTDGTLSEFRGFNLDTDPTTNPATYNFTPVDAAWYSHDGRANIERSSVEYFGYASTSDSGLWTPPFPILDGRMVGLINVLAARPLTNQFGNWPATGTTVARYGTDYGLRGPNQFAGTPISITLPVAEPLLADIGVLDCEMHRTDAPATVPDSWRFFQCYSDVDGLTVPINYTEGVFPPNSGLYEARGLPAPIFSKVNVLAITVLFFNGPPDTWETNFAIDGAVGNFNQIQPGDTLEIVIAAGPLAGTYDYTIDSTDPNTHSINVGIPDPRWVPADWNNNLENVTVSVVSHVFGGVSTLVDSTLRDGEFMIVPVAPLEPNAQYTMNVHLQTATYDSGALQFIFNTDAR